MRNSEQYVTPALSTSGQATGAYEIKFLLPNSAADDVLSLARSHLEPDPNSDPAFGDGYHVNSLYLDTPNFDTYHRTDGFRRKKYRLRRYGLGTSVMLECKAKARGLVKKRRTTVPSGDLSYLLHETSPPNWCGEWYHEKLKQRDLVPACNVSYRRVARVGMGAEGPIRFTVDRDLRCQRVEAYAVPGVVDGACLLDGKSIVEMKFCVAMPSIFKTIVHEFALTPQKVSKFRRSMEECYQLSSASASATSTCQSA